MTRAELLNSIIRARGYRRVLMVGRRQVPGPYLYVSCRIKEWTERVEDARGEYELVYVDGPDHSEDRVAESLRGAMARLAVGGTVVLNGCLPPNRWEQRPKEEFREGQSWYGQVWKVALREMASSPHLVSVVRGEHGCCVIDTAMGRERPEFEIPDALEYERDYGLLANRVESDEAFVRRLGRVTAFYHVAAMGTWKEVVEEHFRLLKEAAFPMGRLRAGMAGTEEDEAWFLEAAKRAGVRVAVVSRASSLDVFESPTILAVERWAKDEGGDGVCCYWHTKGVSRPGDHDKVLWRRLMGEHVLRRWRERLEDLEWADIVGVNWIDDRSIPHFRGNFWWARASHIRRLPDFASYYDHPRYHGWTVRDAHRLSCEFWIGSAGSNPVIRSLVSRNVDYCAGWYWRKRGDGMGPDDGYEG